MTVRVTLCSGGDVGSQNEDPTRPDRLRESRAISIKRDRLPSQYFARVFLEAALNGSDERLDCRCGRSDGVVEDLEDFTFVLIHPSSSGPVWLAGAGGGSLASNPHWTCSV